MGEAVGVLGITVCSLNNDDQDRKRNDTAITNDQFFALDVTNQMRSYWALYASLLHKRYCPPPSGVVGGWKRVLVLWAHRLLAVTKPKENGISFSKPLR